MKLTSLLFALIALPASAATILGVAQPYNVFLFGDMNSQYSDIEGRAAIGGDASFNGYSVGSSIPLTGGPTLVVGGNLSYTNGTVSKGDVVYGGTITTNSTLNIANGTAYQGSPIDFGAAYTQQRTASTSLVGTGASYSSAWGTLTFAATGNTSYNVSNADFNNANTINISGTIGTTVVINVPGSSVNFTNRGISLSGGITRDSILYNFYEAGSLNIAGVSVQGSILAPDAAVSFSNGNFEGTLVAQSVTGNGEFHNHPSNIPSVPEPGIPGILGLGAVALLVLRRNR